MKRAAIKRYSLSAICLWLLAVTAAAGNADFSYCTACHGAHGNGNEAIRAPKISGMEPWYLSRQLKNFRAGLRGAHRDDAAGQEMRPIGVRLADDAAIQQAVAYVASFKAMPPPITLDGDIERGKQIYAACSACHGVRGQGDEAQNAPALAARTDWYLATQLMNFKTGVRGAHPKDVLGAQMRAFAQALPGERAINDVIAYINTLR